MPTSTNNLSQNFRRTRPVGFYIIEKINTIWQGVNLVLKMTSLFSAILYSFCLPNWSATMIMSILLKLALKIMKVYELESMINIDKVNIYTQYFLFLMGRTYF